VTSRKLFVALVHKVFRERKFPARVGKLNVRLNSSDWCGRKKDALSNYSPFASGSSASKNKKINLLILLFFIPLRL